MGYRYDPQPFLDYYGNALDGLEGYPRVIAGDLASVTLSNQNARFIYATARQPVAITKLVIVSGSTPAGATPTLVRLGLYTVASNGDLTLVARSANDTTALGSGSTEYALSLNTTGGYPSSYTLIPGQRYAMGAVVVTAAAAPSVAARIGTVAATAGRSPRVAAFIGSQSDLAASYTFGSLSNSSSMIWMGAVA